MKFKFEKLTIWQMAMDLGEEIQIIAANFPQEEMYNLKSQIQRAADSIALNISEGSIGQSDAENRKFISYSIRSLAEVVTCLHKAKRRKYLADDHFDRIYKYCFDLMNMMIAFQRNIR